MYKFPYQHYITIKVDTFFTILFVRIKLTKW